MKEKVYKEKGERCLHTHTRDASTGCVTDYFSTLVLLSLQCRSCAHFLQQFGPCMAWPSLGSPCHRFEFMLAAFDVVCAREKIRRGFVISTAPIEGLIPRCVAARLPPPIWGRMAVATNMSHDHVSNITKIKENKERRRPPPRTGSSRGCPSP